MGHSSAREDEERAPTTTAAMATPMQPSKACLFNSNAIGVVGKSNRLEPTKPADAASLIMFAMSSTTCVVFGRFEKVAWYFPIIRRENVPDFLTNLDHQ